VSAQLHEIERAFEHALLDVLEHDHRLDVRHADDPLERRMRGVARIRFRYQWSQDRTSAKAIVTVAGADHFSNVIYLDGRSHAAIEASAEKCAALADFVAEYLDRARESLAIEAAAGRLAYGRREDDLC
jgi:hypothetical protein